MVNVSRLRPLAVSFITILLTFPGLPGTASSSSAEAPATEQTSENVSEPEGIPITSELVWEACGSCHQLDDQNRMSRISYMRATPEGWQHKMRRMMGLNGLQIEPLMAREVVRYLSNNLGLAPEEFRPAAFEAERRMIDFTYPDRDTELSCKQCHSLGRVISQRRTREEWELLIAMHRGFYPLIDVTGIRRMEPSQPDAGSEGGARDSRHPMDKAIDHLAKTFPLHTPEWAEWSANMREPKLEGSWGLAGHQLGKGPVYGRVVITASPDAPDEFVTETSYTYPQSGRSATRSGNAIVYTGFQWRGRSVEGDQDTQGMNEVMFVERDWQQMGGRWFTGAYDETGLDITLRRAGSGPMAVGVHPRAVKSSTRGQEVRIYGVNLPTTLEPADLDFGQGVTVTRVVDVTSDVATVELDVAADATVGARDVYVAQSLTEHGFVVYDRIDAIKVTPEWGMARVGGVALPKQYQQFEAVAYHNGPDGTPDTEDDLRLGMVEADWSIDEFPATYDDDDIQYVGAIDAGGLFTPAIDGPNPARRNPATSNMRNNLGDVWVVARFRPEGEARVLRARGHLVVAPPMYRRWYPPEAGQ
jgi:quinohemoprotein amine dehydrogenase